MKKIAAFLLMLASLHARGDIVIEQSEQTDGEKQAVTVTIKIKGDKIRMENQGGILPSGAVILDLAKDGDMIMLFTKDKKFMELPGIVKFAQDEQMKQAQGKDPAPTKAPEIVDTGVQEKVAGYNAEIYAAEDTKRRIKFAFWISKDVPDYAFVQELMRKIGQMGKSMVQAESPDFTKIEGMLVKSVMVTTKPNGTTTTMTTLLVSIKKAPVDDSEFVVPKDYKVTGMLGD